MDTRYRHNPLTALIIAIILSLAANAQEVGIKTNLLNDVLLNPNLGVEVGVAPRWTVELDGQFNAWSLSHDRVWRHWELMPEARLWLCDRFQGHFFAIHALGGQYNIGNLGGGFMMLGTDFRKLNDYRYEGWFVGAGLAYGYAWAIDKHWNLEGEIGLGWAYTRYSQYECAGCSKKQKSNKPHNYIGPTKAAVNLVYLF